jgi:hypothetical protein
MITNNERRELLNRVKSSGYPGGISDVFQAASQGVDLIEQFQLSQNSEAPLTASTPEEQETGLREEHAQGNTGASMAFPDVQPNQSFNTVGMKAPIDIQKVNNQGHLVESYKNVPPGIQDLPTGPAEGTIIESPAAYQKGGVKKEEEFPGLLPEVEVSALTDKSYNKLSDPQKQVYDTFVTPGGIAQTVNLGEGRDMHWKGALQMTEDLGIRNIYNKPSRIFNTFFNRYPSDAETFTPHSKPVLKNITIPEHKGPKHPNYRKFNQDVIDDLKENKEYWVKQLSKEEKEAEIREIETSHENYGRKEYFDNLIAEYAHMPEFWRTESFKNLPVSLAKDIYRFIKGEETDHSRYKDSDHYEYKTHTGPDSFEEKLKSKYEIKRKGGVRKYGEGGPNEHMDLITGGGDGAWETHQQESHHAGGNTGGDTGSMYGPNSDNPTGPPMEWGLGWNVGGSVGPGIRTPYGSYGMDAPSTWQEGLTTVGMGGLNMLPGMKNLKAKGLGKLKNVALGVSDTIGGLFKKGGVRKYQGGGFDFPNPNMPLTTQIKEQEKVIQANKSESDIQFENVVAANAATNKISIAQAKANLIKNKPGHTTYSSDASKTNAITDAYTGAIQETDPALSYTDANRQAINQRGTEIKKQWSDAGKLAVGTAVPLAIGAAATTGAGYAGLSALNTLGRGAANWGWRNLGGRYYANSATQGLNTFRAGQTFRPMAKGLFQAGYNTMKLGALPSFYKHTGKFGKDLVTGNYSNLQDRTLDFGRGVVSIHPGLRKYKEGYKLGQDAWQGNYASVLTRSAALLSKAPGIGKGMEYYGTKLGSKFLPAKWQNLGGIPSLKSVFNRNKHQIGTSPLKLAQQ